MDWNTFYQENHTVIIGGTFTLLGIVIGWLLNLCQSYFTNKRADRLHLRDKREETYLKILSVCYVDRQEKNTNKIMTKHSLSELLEEYYPCINVYASNDIKKIYNRAVLSKENKEEELIEAIRKELGLKD